MSDGVWRDIKRMGIRVAKVKGLDVDGCYVPQHRVALVSRDLGQADCREVSRHLVRLILEDEFRRSQQPP